MVSRPLNIKSTRIAVIVVALFVLYFLVFKTSHHHPKLDKVTNIGGQVNQPLPKEGDPKGVQTDKPTVRLPPPPVVLNSEPEKIRIKGKEGYLKSIKEANKIKVKKEVKSSYKCLGRQTIYEANDRRPCWFKNICLDTARNEYLYYQPHKEPVFYDQIRGPIYSFNDGIDHFIRINSLPYGYVTKFTPKIVQKQYPSLNVEDKPVVLWAKWSWEVNMGHFLFEELSSAFHTLSRFGVKSKDVILLDKQEPTSSKLYKKFMKAFAPAITSNEPMNVVEYIKTKPATENLICFKNLLVSSSTRAFLMSTDEFQIGREEAWQEFRSRILSFHGIDPNKTSTSNQIVLIQKTKSQTKNEDVKRGHFRDIYNLEEVKQHLESKFGNVLVLRPEEHSITEQLEIISKTKIMITPPGGISMLIPFLPPQSTAIIMDYLGQDFPLVGTKNGQSVSMESSLWNAFPHINKIYYQIMDRVTDIKPDYEGALDQREDYSVVLDLDRIEYMVNQAFDYDFSI